MATELLLLGKVRCSVQVIESGEKFHVGTSERLPMSEIFGANCKPGTMVLLVDDDERQLALRLWAEHDELSVPAIAAVARGVLAGTKEPANPRS